MSSLKYEKVGDVNAVYPYLCVYLEGQDEAFMEIFVNEEKELGFQIYPSEFSTCLSLSHIEEILEYARRFLPKAIENGEQG